MVGTIQALKRGIGRVGMMAGILFLAGGWPMAASAADELPKEAVLPATLAGKAVQGSARFLQEGWLSGSVRRS
jgi:hypothetical protein